MNCVTRRPLAALGALCFLMVLAGCGSDEKEALPPVTSLFGSGSPANGVTTSSLVGDPAELDYLYPERSSTTLTEVKRRCSIDTRTLRTAQEAFYARNGRYASTDEELVADGLLSEPSPIHDFEIVPAPPGGMMTFKLIVTSPLCGTPGHTVGQTPADI